MTKPNQTRPDNASGLSAAAPTSEMSGLNPERWVAEHCDDLYRYALTRVSQPETAQDLVQETFLAAWRASEQFAGKASERTWLLRILRNKIVDHYRRKRPEFAMNEVGDLSDLEEKQFAQSGLHRGGWAASACPGRWEDAHQAMENTEFWQVLHRCAQKLPPRVASVFLLREVDGQSTEEICESLKMKRNHLGVLLHRARLALRRCLELHWFRDPVKH